MLRKDGRWTDLNSRFRMWRRTASFLAAVLPVIFRSLLPGHNPRQEPDPAWVRDWIAGYARRDGDSPPLLDTDSHDIPIPFAPEARV